MDNKIDFLEDDWEMVESLSSKQTILIQIWKTKLEKNKNEALTQLNNWIIGTETFPELFFESIFKDNRRIILSIMTDTAIVFEALNKLMNPKDPIGKIWWSKGKLDLSLIVMMIHCFSENQIKLFCDLLTDWDDSHPFIPFKGEISLQLLTIIVNISFRSMKSQEIIYPVLNNRKELIHKILPSSECKFQIIDNLLDNETDMGKLFWIEKVDGKLLHDTIALLSDSPIEMKYLNKIFKPKSAFDRSLSDILKPQTNFWGSSYYDLLMKRYQTLSPEPVNKDDSEIQLTTFG